MPVLAAAAVARIAAVAAYDPHTVAAAAAPDLVFAAAGTLMLKLGFV